MVIRGRVVAPIAATLFVCSVVAALQPQDVGFSSVQSFVNEARATQGLPGLAVVVVRGDGQPQVYVSGPNGESAKAIRSHRRTGCTSVRLPRPSPQR
jgi:hypothetical protein